MHSPTLVISGDADPIVPPVNARILAARIHDAQLELIPGAGHLLLMERADKCATIIAKFLMHERTASR